MLSVLLDCVIFKTIRRVRIVDLDDGRLTLVDLRSIGNAIEVLLRTMTRLRMEMGLTLLKVNVLLRFVSRRMLLLHLMHLVNLCLLRVMGLVRIVVHHSPVEIAESIDAMMSLVPWDVRVLVVSTTCPTIAIIW